MNAISAGMVGSYLAFINKKKAISVNIDDIIS